MKTVYLLSSIDIPYTWLVSIQTNFYVSPLRASKLCNSWKQIHRRIRFYALSDVAINHEVRQEQGKLLNTTYPERKPHREVPKNLEKKKPGELQRKEDLLM